MGRPLRFFESKKRLYFITNRTVHGRLLMSPSPRVNNIIGGVIGRALTLFDVNLYAFTFLSNHPHLILAAAEGELSRFMQYIESNIAKKVGDLVGWKDKFWARRFSAEPILDDDALIGKLRYIFSHGVKENLVDAANQWPGLTCIPELAHGIKRYFEWHDQTAEYIARRRGDDIRPGQFVIRYPIELKTLPCWAQLPKEEQQQRARDIIDEVEKEARQRRKKDKQSVLGVDNILNQDPLEMPGTSKRSHRPLCHASTRKAWDEFKDTYKKFADDYRVASEKFRQGDLSVIFPDHAFKPPLPYGWAPATV